MSSFHERQKDLFNHLKDAEDQISFSKSNKVTNAPDYSVVDRRTYRKLKHEMKQFRGRESIYKRESATIKQCLKSKTIPDHIKNPGKWSYYSLSDVTPDQMSDATNTATALALIQKMEDRDTQDEMNVDTDTEAVFKKPTFRASKTIKAPPLDEDKPVIKSNKIIMPEYVVGVSKKKEIKDNAKKISKKSNNDKNLELKLNHLYEEDVDE